MKDETQGWLDRAEEHLEVASALLGTDHYAQSIFFCQQALEMLLKSSKHLRACRVGLMT